VFRFIRDHSGDWRANPLVVRIANSNAGITLERRQFRRRRRNFSTDFILRDWGQQNAKPGSKQ
jgi:hypothetical protein